ncbi:hypothetical protein [Haloferula rosea]|uniref:Transmembrane protein n=1 Tax=Haloferula rosea TaxID=490093 RepID=A0A934VAM5_9BACT|nr:hypothetical protein [Haloferula rosea]MBK1826473.1 hypothetical protein [Haloferula rosea]
MRLLAFLASFATLNLLLAVAWEAWFPENIYHCTDSLGMDYFLPGDWIHGEWQSSDTIEAHHDMSQPDTLKSGWTLSKLWLAWLGCVSTSIAASHLVALRFKPKYSPAT